MIADSRGQFISTFLDYYPEQEVTVFRENKWRTGKIGCVSMKEAAYSLVAINLESLLLSKFYWRSFTTGGTSSNEIDWIAENAIGSSSASLFTINSSGTFSRKGLFI